MKNVRVIYFSPTHTSAKIACAIAEGIENAVIIETDLTCEFSFCQEIVKDDLVIIAAPVYGGRIPPQALERIRYFQSNGVYAVTVTVYGNRHYDDALLELSDLLKSNGFKVIAAGAFIGEHSYSREKYPVAAGRPDANDLNIAKEFGKQLIKKISGSEELPEISIPGNYPYKAYNPTPAAPVTDEVLCTQCEYCIETCPVNAIAIIDDLMYSDPDKCIKCCACVKFCPEQARIFKTPFSKYLFENFSTPREPELFY